MHALLPRQVSSCSVVTILFIGCDRVRQQVRTAVHLLLMCNAEVLQTDQHDSTLTLTVSTDKYDQKQTRGLAYLYKRIS
eukprot:1193027-Prorocentrum_minimum.AAC.2